MARFIYTPEMKAWMQDNYLLRMDKLSVAFNAHFGTTRSSESLNGLRKRLKLRTGRRGCFTPGSIPANKGTRGVMKANRGSFKKGNRPGNTARVGDETLTEDGYIRVNEPLVFRLIPGIQAGHAGDGADKNGDNTPAAGYKIKQQTWTALT
ncbi:hypothetical protein ACOIWS_005264 [Salmonella enterica]